MGLIKQTKSNMVAEDARKARANGRTVFTPYLNMPGMRLNSASGAIDDWAAMIDAIEGEGWVLAHWAVATDQKGRPEAYPLFRPRV